MTPAMAMSNMLVFVVTFFLARLVYGPYAIYQHSYYLYTVGRTAEESKACLPRGFDHVITIVGMFFNILNAYWFYKILRKLQRKLKGTEGVKESNEYTDDINRKVKFKKEQD
jgi:TLC domain